MALIWNSKSSLRWDDTGSDLDAYSYPLSSDKLGSREEKFTWNI